MKNLTKKHKVALVIGVVTLLVNLLAPAISPLFGNIGGSWSQMGLCLLALVFIYTDKVKLSRITYGVALIICVYGMQRFFLYFDFNNPLLDSLPFITIVISLISTIKIKINTPTSSITSELRSIVYNESGSENQNNTLSNKYRILKTFQWLIGILIIVYIILFIVYMGEYGDHLKDEQLLYTIGLVALQVFLSICIILIVQFLFELDRYKSNYDINNKGKSQ